MDMFKSRQKEKGILRAENYLTSEYTPNELPHREEEIEEIANSIKPMFQGRKPETSFECFLLDPEDLIKRFSLKKDREFAKEWIPKKKNKRRRRTREQNFIWLEPNFSGADCL